MAKESKRQLQVAELLRRNFSLVLQQEGGYIYGSNVLVTVTNVKVSPDFGSCKIYLSVYNTENKQAVILQLEEEYHRLKQELAQRTRRQLRRIPDFAMYLDDTLDEMYKLNHLFNKLHKEKQMGKAEGEKGEGEKS